MRKDSQGNERPILYYGWVIVAVLFIVEFLSYSITGSTVSLFFFPMADDLGWSLTQLTGAITAAGIAGMLAAPLVGWALDRYGPRPVLTIGALSAGVALLLLMRVQTVWQYWILFAIVGAMGMGEMGRLSTPVVVSKWFIRLRGRAMAVATSGNMMGGAVMAPVMGWLIATIGWRESWGLLGLVILLLNLPLVLLFMRRQPEDVGLLPDGDRAEDAASPDRIRPSARRGVTAESSWTLREAMQTRTLWFLVISSNLIGFATASVSYHQVPFFVQQGMSLQAAGYVLMMSLVMSTLSRFLWGYLVDRFSIRACLVALASFRSLGTLSLIAIPYPFNIVPFVVLWGLLGGAFGLVQPMAWANYYGRMFQGSIQGTMRPFLGISRLVGPLSMAILFDVTQSYLVPFLVASALAFSSVGLFLNATPPRRPAAAPHPQ